MIILDLHLLNNYISVHICFCLSSQCYIEIELTKATSMGGDSILYSLKLAVIH